MKIDKEETVLKLVELRQKEEIASNHNARIYNAYTKAIELVRAQDETIDMEDDLK